MRASFAFTIAAFIMVNAMWAQQTPANKPSRSDLISRLRSDNVQVRSEAFESVRTDSEVLRDPKVRVALVDLLDRENHETPSVSGENEGYAEYTSWLADTVAKIVDWSSQRQVCILADSAVPPNELADHAKVAVPCLLQRYKSAQNLDRGYVVAMLVQALAKGKGELDALTVAKVQEAILAGLHDPDHGIRGETIRALGKFGGEDMIPALRASADAETSDDAGSRSIRKRTLKAITEIEKRAGKTQ